MIPLTFNDQYLNRTENKDPRPPSAVILGRCWHETVNGSGDPHSTLNWNLKRQQIVNGRVYIVESSYEILVARDGEAFRYVDWMQYNAWSEGLSSATIDGTLYHDYQLGLRLLGIEFDGPNDGTPATPAQIETGAKIVLLTEQQLHIPPDGKHDFTHAQIAPGRKTDPRGYTIREILDAAAAMRRPAASGLTIMAPPRISLAQFTGILARAKSPAAPDALELYAICLHAGIDPAVALAVFGKESTFGTQGIATRTRSWGNVREPYVASRSTERISGFAAYASWKASLLDWCERITGRYIQERGLTSVEQIVPVYAPAYDDNDVERYIQFVVEHVRQWQHEDVPVGRYVVIVDVALVRTGPGQNHPVAWDGTCKLPRGREIFVDEAVRGTPVEGDPVWLHWPPGGFIHRSVVRYQA